ncbi:hypothetical protein EBT31_20615, partial [bacterium]|nr:hypothetical protein [bacterium]
MSVQLINLGTPNNNDGDSLYAGGTKINANFTELYTQLAGTSTLGSAALRIDLGTAVVNTPVVGSMLAWSVTKNQFVPSSSTMLKTLSHNGSSVLVLTNALGQAGVSSDSVEYQGASTALDLLFNGRRMWDLLATTTGSTALTRGSWYIGLGNAQATSLALTTRGVAIGGVDGLTVYRNTTEESAGSSLTLATGSSGIILYQTPIINYADYVSPLNSSGAVVHSGFVQEAISSRKFADGTSTMVGVRGVAGGGALALSGGGAVDRQLYTDVRFFKNHLQGLTYSYSNPNINVTSGSAAHYSFSVAGASQVSSADVQAFVVVSSTLTRSFTNSATWQSTNTEAALETIVANTWYYLYLIV